MTGSVEQQSQPRLVQNEESTQEMKLEENTDVKEQLSSPSELNQHFSMHPPDVSSFNPTRNITFEMKEKKGSVGGKGVGLS